MVKKRTTAKIKESTKYQRLALAGPLCDIILKSEPMRLRPLRLRPMRLRFLALDRNLQVSC